MLSLFSTGARQPWALPGDTTLTHTHLLFSVLIMYVHIYIHRCGTTAHGDKGRPLLSQRGLGPGRSKPTDLGASREAEDFTSLAWSEWTRISPGGSSGFCKPPTIY